MVIRVECACGKRLTAPDSAAGKRGRCPTCGRMIEIPSPGGADSQTGAGEVESASQDEAKGTCLIAEDDQDYLDLLSEMFEQHGYQVVRRTTNSTEAMDGARELNPEVIVVDVKLRPMSGFRVVQALTDPTDPRNKSVWQAIFVMLAPTVRGRDKQYALSLGVEIYVQKPFAPASVFPRVERRLKQRGRR